MSKLRVAVQCNEYGQRGGIATYANRLNEYLNGCKDVSSKVFVERIRNNTDIISLQFEPGLMPPKNLNELINKYSTIPIVITCHHMGYLQQFYPMIDGMVLHSKDQIPDGPENEPWDYTVIPHPAIVYPKKDKKKLRKKYGLPQDKVIIGTAGFIVGTGKNVPNMTNHILKNMNDDEFFYAITSYWKGGDWGKEEKSHRKARGLGKENQFRMDTDFVSEEILNEKMQCCDLLFAWNNMYHGQHKGSQSGIAPDMYGSRVKLMVKDGPHYSFIGSQEGVLVGRPKPEDFIDDVLHAVRNEDLKNVPDPTHLSWQSQIQNYVDYFKQFTEA